MMCGWAARLVAQININGTTESLNPAVIRVDKRRFAKKETRVILCIENPPAGYLDQSGRVQIRCLH
jgi:hypothetical protein